MNLGGLIDRATGSAAARLDRRGFLRRTALVGSALAVAPGRYLLRPGSAYAAICTCSGSSCGCGSTCCDGYTEFCCTITGRNSCPAGTATGGWWKADGSGLCSGAPRYYLDCNVVPPNSPCSCGCANGSCSNRKACCTRFRYGQCHQEIATMGPIMCRVVTCTPPWQFDPSCTTATLTDNNTRFHDAPCLHAATAPTPVGWYLRNDTEPGQPEITVTYGMSDYTLLAGDWTGDGSDS
ncbi:MAG: twin-arginine translocation signal domain-containing protein, partial [Acidimicrobiales bacterium]